MNERRSLGLDTVTSSIRWCLSGYLTLRPAFQGYIIKILAKKLDCFVIVYLDDILIYTKDKGQGHVEAVW